MTFFMGCFVCLEESTEIIEINFGNGYSKYPICDDCIKLPQFRELIQIEKILHELTTMRDLLVQEIRETIDE